MSVNVKYHRQKHWDIILFDMNHYQFITVFLICVFFNMLPAHAQGFSASIDGEYGTFKPPPASYLGTQSGGANTFNFVKIGEGLDLKSTGLNLSYQIPESRICKKLSWLKLVTRVEKGRADDKQVFDTIDPGGATLIVPGVGIGASGTGFSLVGPNNQITEGLYNIEHDYLKVMLGVESELETSYSKLRIFPSFGIEYADTETTNSFGGNIPLFLRSFSYQTDTQVRSISPTVGVKVSYDISPTLTLFSDVKYSYNFNDGNSQDNLTFTGFGTQSVDMNNHSSTDSVHLKVGTDINFKLPIKLTLEGNYSRIGNVPRTQVRTGASQVSFDYKNADIFSGGARLTYQFTPR